MIPGNDVFGGGRIALRPGPVPLHYQVYQHLRELLDQGKLRPGDRLPGERELCDFYGCSLITVRRALDELARARRLVRMRGKGTFVTEAPVDRDLQVLDSFTQEMRERGFTPSTRLLLAEERPATAPVAERLNLELGVPAYVLERLRLIDGQPLLLEEVHLSAIRFPGLLQFDLARESLYDLLAKNYGTKLRYAQEIIEPVALPAREAALLDQKRGRPALRLELLAYDQNEAPIEYCRSLVRGDRARYHIDARGPRSGRLWVST